MTRPFSARVGDPVWLAEAVDWIETRLGRRVDDVVQPRIRPWSTQLRVVADGSVWWFKANCPAQRFEPALQAVLADLVPGSFDAPAAFDADRGWMLTSDRGPTWGEQDEPGLDQWCALVREAALVQHRLAEHGTVLLGAGVPDCSPATVLSRFDRFVALLADQPPEHPSFLPPELRVQVEQRRPAIEAAAETLQASRLPVTWQHGDLHPWNVFMVGGGPRLFDLGDSQWAHALEILCVPFGWTRERTDLPWEPVLEAYADAWDLPASVIEADWVAAGLTQAVNRVLTWWTCLAEATADEWQEWGEAPRYHLSRVIDP